MDSLVIGAIIKEFMARTGVNALVIKLLDNIDDCSVGWGLQCRLPVSESHCTLPRVATVDLIGHLELYEFSLMSNQYGP